MKLSKLLLAVSLMFILIIGVAAQKKTAKPITQSSSSSSNKKSADNTGEEKKVSDIISFLEYMLNTIGNNMTPIRDKEVVITESYAKIFRDSKVQIEDDLDEDRVVVTNKDIVAYLKDVNFFFANARFEFAVEEIEKKKLPSGDTFYKVSTTRNLKGTTVDKKSVNNTIPRFIEINYSSKDDDLKIVSIYTNGIDEKRALTLWWNELSHEWHSIFKKKLLLADSVRFPDIKAITAIDEMDLSNNRYIQDITPLGQLTNLRFLNLAGTNIDDLTAIRNLTELRSLNISNTKIKDLTPLKYSSKLEKLNINNTGLLNIDVVSRMPELKTLELNSTRISDFSPIRKLNLIQKLNLSATKITNLNFIEHLSLLTDLDLAKTNVQEVNPLAGLSNLNSLILDSTHVRDLTPLSNLESLKSLHINFTAVTNLSPLRGLRKLEKIYCDQTPIQREDADELRKENPNVLVVFDSNDLKIWWEALAPDWQKVLRESVSISENPAKEELAKIPLMDTINLRGIASLRDLEPLRKLPKLKVVDVSGTGINDLMPLFQHKEIIYLNISETKVRTIGPIRDFTKIKIIQANNTLLENIENYALPSLEELHADNTNVHEAEARGFLEKNPTCLLIFKTKQLNQWWSSLSFEWREIFKDQVGPDLKPTSVDLHTLVEKQSFQIKNAAITNLSGLHEFFRLKELRVTGAAMTSITPLNNLTDLKILQVSGSPLREIDSLFVLSDLEELDISNTPLEDIYPIWRLKNLKNLNCSGTQIKHLDVLERLENLEYLDCSNTRVNKLNALDYLPLKTLKCYNTKLSTRSIESFRDVHPKCDVQFYR